jgi:signal transduction histidine kinase
VTELLDISRLETGRLVLRRQMVDVAEVAERVVARLAMELPDLDCTLEFSAGFPRIYADPDKVEQVLTNLVENAAKYASPTGMRITAEVEGSRARISVQDQGDGIPEASLSHVFDRFFRRDHGRPTGTGLGLWISRGIVQAHGGELIAESRPGEGSTFSFTLPTGSFDELVAGE